MKDHFEGEDIPEEIRNAPFWEPVGNVDLPWEEICKMADWDPYGFRVDDEAFDIAYHDEDSDYIKQLTKIRNKKIGNSTPVSVLQILW